MDENEILDRELKVGRLQEILESMEVPEKRRTDLAWLGRNLGIQNRFHVSFPEAAMLIRELMPDNGIVVQ